ncbi:nucleotide sugar dehydrogenase [Leucobacter sp. USHLN154]|uniref:nucleotide sugar dehydrogenase n=1 Tax=Leucobacter sp. USHLN154 TaxID=3081269 RepID=UPI0030189664
MKLVVVGQGYVGLPLAMRAVEAGLQVVGVDLDPIRVAALEAGRSYVDDVTSETLEAALRSGNYSVSSAYSAAEGFDYAVITVPTPLISSAPDLSFVESAAQSLGPLVRRGATVVLESTTYPGTTEELVQPILEDASGLKAGEDFYLGYSPERIDPGNREYTFRTTPKIVSGINLASLNHVDDLFSVLVDRTVRVSGTREAETAKLLENTFRHVNIALVNELAMFANDLKINVWETIEAAATKPFGFMKFTPGPGVGGHCLPIDPSYLSWKVKADLGRAFRFVELANDVNDHMPEYVVRRSMTMLNDDSKSLRGSHILLVGLAYKRNSSDFRESPAARIIELLHESGARISAADDHISSRDWPRGVERKGLSADALKMADLVLLVTDHSSIDLNLLRDSETPVLDTRNKVRGTSSVAL